MVDILSKVRYCNFYLIHIAFRKGKVKAFDMVMKDDRFVELFASFENLESMIDTAVVSEFVCHLYGKSKIKDVNEARFVKLLEITDNVAKVRSPSSVISEILNTLL